MAIPQMTTAVCIQCGAIRKKPTEVCPRCGYRPGEDPGENARCIILSDANIDSEGEPKRSFEELKSIAESIERGVPFSFDPGEVESIRRSYVEAFRPWDLRTRVFVVTVFVLATLSFGMVAYFILEVAGVL